MKRYRTNLMVCAGTGCVSNHSLEIREALENELKKHNLEDEISIVLTGCNGFCANGPHYGCAARGDILSNADGGRYSPSRRRAFSQGEAGQRPYVHAAEGGNSGSKDE